MNTMDSQHKNAQIVTNMTVTQAPYPAMDIILKRDDDMVVLGQNTDYFGSMFHYTKGL